MPERVAVFIDNGYLSKVVPKGTRIDFLKYSTDVCRGRERLRTYFYDCMPYQSDPPQYDEKVKYAQYCKFRDIIESLPRFQMRLGKLKKNSDGTFEQKRVDILLAVELVRLSWSHQIGYAVVVTGDSDFVPAIEAAKEAGVITTLYYSKGTVHNELLSAVDERYEMDQAFFEKVRRENNHFT
ncbi:NYN domain-containing protein [uncultured Methanofollis sp.]|uniref:NYN domain-containing protein n=1 Tax=uncultured Methanofollis sp. TaxID=262500 RepID=UPI00260E5F81|nr:NYN domain-containing protein [uncultured Methanofollis sp.]